MNTYELQKIFSEDRFAMIYMANFSDELTELILGIQNIRSDDIHQLRKRISFLATESYQNIIRHCIATPAESNELSPHFFLTRSFEKNHFIATKNIVDKAAKEKIEQKLNTIKRLDDKELKALYLDILNNQEISKKGGAGLGFIEMARKSKHPINYLFEPIGDFFNFFLQLKIQGTNAKSDGNYSLSDSKKIYELCERQNIVFLLRGDFSPESIEYGYAMLNENIVAGSKLINFNSYLYNLLADMISLISHTATEHNGVKKGTLIISKIAGGHQIDICNCINLKSLAEIRELFSEAAKLNLYELKSFYETLPSSKKRLCSLDLLSFFTFEETPISYYLRDSKEQSKKQFTLSMKIYN
jgi:hypothetical protein